MNKEKNKNYLNSKDFFDLIIKYKYSEITKREENTLGKMIILLVNKIATKANFCGYTYLDEMKSYAYYNIWKNLNVFDETRTTNAFAYFTQVTINSFIFIINKEKKILERKLEFNEYEIDKIYQNSEIERYAKKIYTQEFRESNVRNYD